MASTFLCFLLSRPHLWSCSCASTGINLLALVETDIGSHRFSFTVGQHEACQLGEHTKTGMWTNKLLACLLLGCSLYFAGALDSNLSWTHIIGVQSLQRRTTNKNDTRKNRHAGIEWDGMGCTARGQPPPSSL